MSGFEGLFLPPLSPLEIMLAMGVFSLASLLQSSVGFGSVILSGPFLVLLEPRFVPGPVLLAGILISALVIGRDGFHAEIGNVCRLGAAQVVGSVVGALVLIRLSAEGVAVALAVFLLVSVAASIRGLSFSVTRRSVVITGFVSGVAGTVAGLAGAAAALLFQNEQGVRLRGSMAAYLLPGTVISAAIVAVVGRIALVEVSLFLVLVPAVLAGHFLSTRYQRIIDRFVSRPLVLSLSGVAAMGVIVRLLLTK